MNINSIQHTSAQAMLPLAATQAAASTSTGSTTGATGSSGSSNNQLTGDSFITLLTAQLQAQDPFNPVDPTTFMDELVQFNSLQQLIDINTQLSALASAGSGSTSGSGSSGSSNSANAAASVTGSGSSNPFAAPAAANAAASSAITANPLDVPALFSNSGAMLGSSTLTVPTVPATPANNSGSNSNPNLALWSGQPSN